VRCDDPVDQAVLACLLSGEVAIAVERRWDARLERLKRQAEQSR
jgi:hypothetical protein